ncbi:general stress protein [Rhodomicrobium vannielii ATCC 17100]|uniref:general stress protein n=1 Tax=Rhodomicrobium vannielii TaxID=1069 RepID=UPI00191AAF35|nr:general stress protein [Rhodomicrobium vannielii]MBJ7535485.1 general stress protein [Rhodomicrobium vannielii ATCC 17100]
MTVTITHVYDTYESAESAIRELEAAGFHRDEISIIGTNAKAVEDFRAMEEKAEGDAAATGATLGGVAGAGAGMLASLGLVAIPGIGPLVAAGVLATTLAGAATGAVAGGLLGGLVAYGITEDEAEVYAESLKRGGTLVSLRAAEDKADEAERIMLRHRPVDMEVRADQYRADGWQGYDPEAPAFPQKESGTGRQQPRAM